MRRTPFHLILAACVALTTVLPACSGGGDKNNDQRQQQTTTRTKNTTIQTNGTLGDGLDLSRLPSLVQKAKTGDELEEILNTSGVNNLDTNKDGNIDFLNVEEVREQGSQGFTLYTNEGNERLDIAKIDVSTVQQTANVAVQGNPQYYGQPVQYQSSFPLAEILLVAWLLDFDRPKFGHRGYRYGSYPKYYKSSRVMPMASYRTKVGSGNLMVKGQPLNAAASRRTAAGTSTLNSGSNKRTMSGGTSFSTTGNKRPAGSVSNSTGFGTNSSRSGATGTGSTSSTGNTRFGTDTGTRSSTGSGAFGSGSNRSKPTFSFPGTSSGSTSRSSGGFGSSSRRSSGGGGGRRRR